MLAALVLALSAPPPLPVLFLGDAGHHQPRARFAQLRPVFAARGITLTYTDALSDLNPDTLAKYAGLVVFANHTKFGSPTQEQAVLDFVAGGKGFVPLHCGSFCFIDSPKYVELVGGQFRSHTTGVFRTRLASPHPVTAGFEPFESWDETYVHHKHAPGKTVLEVRADPAGVEEPWTWVKSHGKGRVFYTAWGHDHRTWSHPGFHNLLERGVRWACGGDPAVAGAYRDRPAMTKIVAPGADFTQVPAKVPFYPKSDKWGVIGDPIPQMQTPLSPEKSRPHYSVPEGFELRLFAADADFGGKPMAMTWDERGRLWVAVTVDYPNEMQKPGEGRDKVLLCEDTNDDGRADTFTTFADKLSIPTSILRVWGGLLVHQAPHTLFLKDTDGDGKADLRQVVLDGWATNDTHAGPSNLRYGPDGWVYGAVGYAGFRGTVAGERFNFKQGYYRFRLDRAANSPHELAVSKLEFLRSTNNNTWGLGFTEEGHLVGSTANGCPVVHMPIPNRYYERVKGLTPAVLPNVALSNAYHPVTTKVRQVDWHGGFTSAAGLSVYTARTYPPEYWNKVAFVSDPTGHLTAAFRLNPAGASYVAQYGWNLVASDDEWAAPIDAQVGPDGMVWIIDWYAFIVQHNPTPAGFTNGKGNAYETPIRKTQHPYGRIYRLVYTQAKPEPKADLGAAEADLQAALKHDNKFWRDHARRLLAEQREQPPAGGKLVVLERGDGPTDLLARCLDLADRPTGSAADGEFLIKLAAEATDPALADAVVIAGSANAAAFLDAAVAAGLNPAARRATELVARNFADKASPADLSKLLAALADKPAAAEPVLAGLAAGWPRDKPAAVPADVVTALLPKLPPAGRGRLLVLAGRWQVPGLDAATAAFAADLLKTVADPTAKDADRLAAAKQAVEFRPADAAVAEAVLAAGLVDALTESTAPTLGQLVLGKLKGMAPSARPAAVRLLLARPATTRAFLDAVEAGTVRFDLLALDQRSALAAHPDATIAGRAKRLLAMGGGLPSADRQKVIDGLHHVLAKVGDPAAGKAAFAKHCAKCHKHGGEGQVIGPDLTGFAVHPKEEILIHVLDPSRSVEGNYKSYTAKLADGRVVTGLLAAETKTTVELLDAENKRHALQRDDIDELVEGAKSLMPEGFEQQMTAAEITDLLEFLTQKGQFLPLPLDKAATASSGKGLFFAPESKAERLELADWSPRTLNGVPFVLIDPKGGSMNNVVLLNGPNGRQPPLMPKAVAVPCGTAAAAIHILGGVSGWGHPYSEAGSASLTVRLHYADGKAEDHRLVNGTHLADYIRRVDVPGSAFAVRFQVGQQARTVTVTPKRSAVISRIEFVKGADDTAPLVLAVTVAVR
jgi:hypothetical protein